MNLNQLEYFLKLTETMNYITAAEQLNISRSGLYSAIAALEKELDVRLFDKDINNIVINPYGILLKEYADIAINGFHKMLNEINQLKSEQEFPINVAVSIGYDFDLFSDIINHYSAKNNKNISIEQMELPAIIEQLRKKQVMFGFSCITDSVLSQSDLNYFAFKEEQYKCFVHKDNPLAKQKSVKFSDLYNETFILYSNYNRNRYTKKMREYGYEINCYPGIYSKKMVFSLVGKNLGICICGCSDNNTNENIIGLELEDDFNKLHLGIIWLKNSYLPPYAQDFLKTIKKYTIKI